MREAKDLLLRGDTHAVWEVKDVLLNGDTTAVRGEGKQVLRLPPGPLGREQASVSAVGSG